MPTVQTADIRNIALVGHAGCGKTTLLERLLHDAGVIGRMGTIEEKNTVADFEPEEKEHGHSLSSAVVQFMHEGKKTNIIDTPGYPDFMGQAIPALPAVETCAIVVDAVKGVQSVARRMKRLSDERKLPNMIIVNRIDSPEADLAALLPAIQESLGADCLPINLPAQGGQAVIDVYENESGESDIGNVAEAHTQITDQVVEVNDALMEKYLGGEEITKEERHDCFEQALREGHVTPILFCSAKTGVGVAELLAHVVHLCPSPLEGNPRPFVREEDGEKEPWTPVAEASKPACAHVFKIATDPFVGKLAFFRVHQGEVKANSSMHHNDDKKPLRIGHLLNVRGKDHEEVDSIVAGDIGAVAKVEELKVGDILHDGALHHVHLESIALPRPMFGQGILPKSRGDETKVGTATHKLMDEDPTFVVERVEATHQTVARGLGELHMRIMIERLKNRYGVEITTEPLRIAYKETIAGKAEGHHRHKKQTGGAGQFGEVHLRVEPLPKDSENGFEFVDDTFGGSIPKQFMPAIEKGIRQSLQEGVVAGYPFTGVRVSVYDGKHHPVDSKEVAFIAAGKKAFRDAVMKAKPILLEPYVELEVTAPAAYLGDLTSDLSGKRGRVQGTDMLPGDMIAVRAIVPLSETLNYASQLKSLTQGQGAFTMDFSHEEQAPPNVQADVVALHQPKHEED